MAVARTSGLGSGKSGQGAAVDGGGSAAAVTTVGALLASGGLAWDSANGNEKSPKIRRQGGPSTAHVRGQRATPAGGASAVSPQRSSSFQRSVGHPGSTPALWVAADVGGTSAWRGGGDGGDRRRRPAVRYGGGVGQPGGAGRRWRPPATACPVAAENRARSQQPSSGAAKMIQVGAPTTATLGAGGGGFGGRRNGAAVAVGGNRCDRHRWPVHSSPLVSNGRSGRGHWTPPQPGQMRSLTAGWPCIKAAGDSSGRKREGPQVKKSSWQGGESCGRERPRTV